jgi:MFS family permease
LRRRALIVLPLFIVTAASLLFLAFTGYGEAGRVYAQLRLTRIAELGQVLEQAMDTFAQTGLPIRQFTGFASQSRTLAEVDPAIAVVAVIDGADQIAFVDPPAARATLEPLSGPAQQEAGSATNSAGDRFRLTLPVRDKFGVAATILIEVDRAAVGRPVVAAFGPLLALTLAAALAFLAVQLVTVDRAGAKAKAAPSAAFVVAFAIVACGLMVVIFQLYAAGVRGKTEALAQSIGERLSAATEFGIALSSFSGLDVALAAYRRIDPDLSWVAVIANGTVVLHTDTARVGKPYAPERGVYEFSVPLRGPAAAGLRVAAAVPVAVVLRAVWSSSRNFLALFVACGLIALIFLPAGRAIAERGAKRRLGPMADGDDVVGEATHRLAILKAAYFLGVFVDAVSLSFLPQWSTAAARAAGLSPAAGSWPFTISFVVLTAALLPAGRYAARGSLKRLMTIGLLCTAIGPLIIAAMPGFASVCVGRGLSGFGQALLLVAVQSYGLAVSGWERRTQAVGIQVYAFSGGLICGGAIGGLLASLVGERTTFLIGGGIGAAALVYVLLCLDEARQSAPTPTARRLALFADLRAALGDGGFVRSLLLGIVGKFVFAGIAMFAVPLILHQNGFRSEDIGQIMMLYALAVLVATRSAARRSDRYHGAGPVLAAGSAIAGLGIVLVGLALTTDIAALPPAVGRAVGPAVAALATSPVPQLTTILIVIGVVSMGVSQGMLAAPAITYAGDTQVAQQRGRGAIVAIYRLLERAGHISGPLVVGALLTAVHGTPLAIGLIGLVSLGAALLFWISGGTRQPVLRRAEGSS